MLFFVLFFSQFVFAHEPLPLWEAGAGLLPFRANHYRGSAESDWQAFPFPALTIRGKTVESENGYIRSHIARLGPVTLDVSLSVGLNVKSDGDRVREGMEDLDPTFEVGPMLRWYLWKSPLEHHFVNLEMPYRAVYATDLSYLDHVGYFSIPYLNLLSRPTEDTFGWSSEVSIGAMYGSRQFHNRFYAVQMKDVTAVRPYYHAQGGYSGMQFSWVLSKRIGQVLVIPFLRYDYLDGAAFRDSPLVRTNHYFLYGAGLVWFFAASSEKQGAPTMVK